MKNISIAAAASVVIVAMMLVSMVPPIKAEEPLKCPVGDDVQISNSSLTLGVFDSTGSINLRTADGTLLLYPADTSNIAFQVDGSTQKSTVYGGGLNSFMIQSPTVTASDSVSVKWKMNGVSLGITYKLIDNNLQVTAVMTNEEIGIHQVGLRFLLDTMLGPDDGAPLYAPDIGVKTFETDIPNPAFTYWMAYDFYPNPSMTAYGTLTTIPDRVAFTWWPNSFGSLWDYACNPNQRFYTPGQTTSPASDSAVLMYYNPVILVPFVPRTVTFYYGLSRGLESWKNSIISELDSLQSHMNNIVDSTISNYANMMIDFNNLGVQKGITMFKDAADGGFASDWTSNLGILNFFLDWANLLDDPNLLQTLESINPTNFESVIPQIGSALADPTNAYKWGWVSRDFKYSGVGVALVALDVVSLALSYCEGVQMQAEFQKVASFNSEMLAVYESTMNKQLDLQSATTALYTSFGNDIKNQIKTTHDQLVSYVSGLTLPQGVDPNYFLNILRDTNSELSQAYVEQRNIVVIGDKKYSIADLGAYKTTTDSLYDAIVNAKNIETDADVVSAASGVAGLVLDLTGVGGAACWIVSLASAAVSFGAQLYALEKEQSIYDIMFAGTQVFCGLSLELPSIASRVYSLATTCLGSVHETPKGQLESLTVENSWDLWHLRYDSTFSVTADNLASVSSTGFLLFNVRPLGENLLADMNSIDVSFAAMQGQLLSLPSTVHFSFWGADFEARFELWLGYLRVYWATITYHVGVGGGIQTNTIMEGNIATGQSQSVSYDSTSSPLNSEVVLDYAGSEINLHIYDSNGHHLGLNYLTGMVDADIPGARYSGIRPGNEWAILPAGIYTVQVVCISAEASERFTVTSSRALESPTADFTYSPDPMIENQAVIFDASNSTAGSGTISEYIWDFGDGNSTVNSNPITSHVYELKGTYNITLTVQNTYGLNDTIWKVRDVLRHDIAVTEVVPYRSWVYEGRLIPVNVTLLNCGDFNETVTLDLYYNLTANQKIGTVIADLSPNETRTLTFVWNTLGVQHCHNYTITAIANIQFDSNTTNNVAEGTQRIKVRIMGDINGDGKVDIRDIALAASAFGSYPSYSRWNPDADINENGKIDLKDIASIAKNFGKCA